MNAQASQSASRHLASRTNKLTLGNGDMVPIYRGSLAVTETTTWLWIVPLESHCYAARVGFANPYSGTMNIISASLWPSDGYNPVEEANGPGTSVGVPTGNVRGSAIYFDQANVGNANLEAGDLINIAGTHRTLALRGDSSNTENRAAPFHIVWSDFVPVSSIERSDGAGQPLLFIYCAIGPGAMTTAGIPSPFAFCTPAVSRGRYQITLASERGDWSMNPRGSKIWGGVGNHKNPLGAGTQMSFNPVLCIQYLSKTKGIQIVTNGDSHAVGTTDDAFSTEIQRAAYDLSNYDLPICVANLAWGGAAKPCLAKNISQQYAEHPS